MADNYLCTVQRAIHPFYIESIGVNIYSIEELCYYLSHYVYLIDESILNEKLVHWIGEELKLEKLSKNLMHLLENSDNTLNFFLAIFHECGYLRPEQIKAFQEELNDLQVESVDVRRKMKGDYLLSFEMYVNAISEYEKILEKRSPGRFGIQFYAQVLENMATAYAHMFQFEEAAECLWESYQSLRSKKVYEKYLRLLPMFLSKKHYEERLDAIRANSDAALRLRKDTEEILCEASYSEFAQSMEKISNEEFLDYVKNSYLRNTAGTR